MIKGQQLWQSCQCYTIPPASSQHSPSPPPAAKGTPLTGRQVLWTLGIITACFQTNLQLSWPRAGQSKTSTLHGLRAPSNLGHSQAVPHIQRCSCPRRREKWPKQSTATTASPREAAVCSDEFQDPFLPLHCCAFLKTEVVLHMQLTPSWSFPVTSGTSCWIWMILMDPFQLKIFCDSMSIRRPQSE